MTTSLCLAVLLTAAPAEWLQLPPVSQADASRGKILADILSHATPEERKIAHFDDPTTCAHETTHLINGRMSRAGTMALYCLDGWFAVLKEPVPLTLVDVRNHVPALLRGNTYQLYMVSQARQEGLNSSPLYMFDEWVAYINGLACTLEMCKSRGEVFGGGSDVVFTLEAAVRCIAVMSAVDAAVQEGRIEYDSQPLHEVFQWNWQRMMVLVEEARHHPRMQGLDPDGYYRTLAQSQDEQVDATRAWCRKRFGLRWTRRHMRF